ncbi:MAG: alternative ribosome rescue aminoacyl-tRNA hydrolase ArfB [Planctomycetota bacterium]
MSLPGNEKASPRAVAMAIPAGEFRFEFARAPGPGGQNVNKRSTRATLCFSLAGSEALSEEEKRVLSKVLANRIGKDGVLRVTARGSRSQSENRQAALARFRHLVAAALQPRKARKKTRPGPSAREGRLKRKQKRSRIKIDRKRTLPED